MENLLEGFSNLDAHSRLEIMSRLMAQNNELILRESKGEPIEKKFSVNNTQS